jgi:hypothetical protein
VATKYTFYIDESGDPGIRVVRSGAIGKGATPYFVFGGCLLPNKKAAEIRAKLENLRGAVCPHKPILHCSELSHAQVARIAREVGKFENILFFAFVSRKDTLESYRKEIEGADDSEFYFNKCATYLLEQLALATETYAIDKADLSIVFEDRPHSFQRYRSYLKHVITKPIPIKDPTANANRKRLGRLDPLSITSMDKGGEPLLFLADLVAYATRQALEPSQHNYGVPEQRYLREIAGKFFGGDKFGSIGDYGFKVYLRHQVTFDKTTKDFVAKLYRVKKTKSDQKS